MSAGPRPEVGLAVWLRPGEIDRAERLIRLLDRSGIRNLRLGVSWADHHLPGGAQWYSWLMPRLAEVAELLPCVLYTPPSLGVIPTTASPPREPKDYADFLDVFVTEHGRLFEWIELWNEPNNLNDWDWRLDPGWEIYGEMIVQASYWMRQRGKRTVLGGTSPTDAVLLEDLRCAGVLGGIDALSVHAFPETWTPHWHGWGEELAQIEEVAQRCHNPPEIWITEAGYSTWRHDEARQAMMFAEAAQAPAARMYWYGFDDLDPELPSQEGFHFDERHYHCGVVYADGRPKLLARLLERGGVEHVLRAAPRLHLPRVRRVTHPVVITGGAGFLGSNLADRLASEGRDVLIFDSLARPGVEVNLDWLRERHGLRITPVVADIRDAYALREAVRHAQAVIHLAAQVAVTSSLERPVEDFEINARGTLNLLEALRTRSEPPPLLFASTNKVYGQPLRAADLEEGELRYQPRDHALRRGCDESTPLDLLSPYGCSKGVADQYVLDYARTFGLPTVVFRMSCVYGPRQLGTEDQGWLAHFLIATLRDEPVTIYGDGRQVRDVLFVDDAVEAWLRSLEVMDDIAGRAFNLGGGPRHTLSLLEMVALIERVSGRAPEVRHGPWRPGDQLWYVSNTSAFEKATGWRAKTPPQAGVWRLLEWLEDSGLAPRDEAGREARA